MAGPGETRFYDYFEKLTNQNDFAWSLQLWNPNPNLILSNQDEIREKVLKSRTVQSVINQLSTGPKKAETLVKQAEAVLVEMEHHFEMKSIRAFSFVLSKLLRRLFRGLIINLHGIEQLRLALKNCPVVFLPTHRSYVDFLLISYICFAFNLPMPVIAAGADFKSMALFSKLLQNAGAFYIRRSFGDDKLYWALVTEYVQYHLKNMQAPVEFFIEGTRSRCGKLLPPKQGMLSMVLELYMKNEIPDVALCPINVTYDRTIEELLYLKELLGVPKLQESTKGLFSALRRILKENFGQIYVNIGEPLLASRLLQKRVIPDWIGALNNFSFTESEKATIQEISQKVSLSLQRNCVVPTFAIIAAAIVTMQDIDMHTLEMVLTESVEILRHMGIPYHSKGISRDLNDCLLVHENKLQILSCGKIKINVKVETAGIEKYAIPKLLLQHYSNQLLAPLICPAVYLYIKQKSSDKSMGTMEKTYGNFAAIFRNEFLLLRSADFHDCEEAETVLSPSVKMMLLSLLLPYVVSAYLLISTILQGFCTNQSIKEQYKNFAVKGLEGKVLKDTYEILALDQIQRHLENMTNLKILQKKKKDGNLLYYNVDFYGLQKLADVLETYVDVDIAQYATSYFRDLKLAAKL